MKYDGTIIGATGAIAEVAWLDEPPALHSVLTLAENKQVQLVVVSSASSSSVFCMVIHAPIKLARGQHVIDTRQTIRVPVGESILGRAFDIFGQAHDNQGAVSSQHTSPLFSTIATNPANLVHSDELLETGIKVIDFFSPLKRGGKVALVGGAGTGKTVVLTELINRLVVKTKESAKRVAVFSAVGERSREALELYQDLANSHVLSRTCLLIGQMGENPAVRWHTAYASAAIVEYFRDVLEKEVLFFMDNVFRFAQAGQELSTLMQTIPSEDSYQATLSSEMANLNQRLISTNKGFVTSVMALFVPSDDLTDAAVRSVLPYLDTIVILSRDIYQQGRYPAVDIINSSSTAIVPDVVGQKHYRTHVRATHVLEQAASLERIVSLVGLKELSSTDQATYIRAQIIQNYMSQDLLAAQADPDAKVDNIPRMETIDTISDILDGKYDQVAPEKFLFIGSVKNLANNRQPKIRAAA